MQGGVKIILLVSALNTIVSSVMTPDNGGHMAVFRGESFTLIFEKPSQVGMWCNVITNVQCSRIISFPLTAPESKICII